MMSLRRLVQTGLTLSKSQSIQSFPTNQVSAVALSLKNRFTSTRGFASDSMNKLPTNDEQATGIEKMELDALKQGIDPFHEDWLDAPFGTETEPVKVTSFFSERIVGVPDPDDDSIVWWGKIKEGEPPRQLVEGGEFFVLDRQSVEGMEDAHGH